MRSFYLWAITLGLIGMGRWFTPSTPAQPDPAWAQVRHQFTDQEWTRLLRSALPGAPSDPTNAVFGDDAAAAFGRSLFYDKRLSGNGEVSCATCHDPGRDWTDGRQLAEGIAQLPRHTPSLWNAAHHRWQFWDGRADSLWAQAIQPLLGPDEMGGSPEGIAQLVCNDAELANQFEAAFGFSPSRAGEDPTGILVCVAKALAAFEGRILTPPTPFDTWLGALRAEGGPGLEALDSAAQAGAKLFFGEAMCHRCHHGPLLSDLEFHDIDLPRDEAIEAARHGGLGTLMRDPFNGSGEYSDDPRAGAERLAYLKRTDHQRGEWKTPGLRNVARTAPYMHNGLYASLDEVLEHYSTLHDAPARTHSDVARVLEPAHLTVEQKQDIIAFLNALSSPPPHAGLLAPRE